MAITSTGKESDASLLLNSVAISLSSSMITARIMIHQFYANYT
jgi:hypothetical protein